VSYSYVAKYVARRRAEITVQDRDGAEGVAGFVPQVREPGAEAEVDFGAAVRDIRPQRRLESPDEVGAFEQDLLAEFVLARA
jgi:hypothetical protein